MAFVGPLPALPAVHRLAFPLLLLLLFFVFCQANAQQQQQQQQQRECQAGKVTLQHVLPFTTATDVFGKNAMVSFFFCALAAGEGSCAGGERGYVEVATETECVDSFTEMTVPLTASKPQSTYLIVASTKSSSTFRLNMHCNSSGLPGEVSYGGEIRTSRQIATGNSLQTLSFEADFFSAEGCEAKNFFCKTADDCVGTSCINDICIDATCPILSTVSQTTTVPANYFSMLRVTDCYGFPVQGLDASNISVLINGVSIDDPPLSFDVDSVRREALQSGTVQVTTLMIQQTRHVMLHYEDELKKALLALLKGLAAGQPTNHYIALVVFDGALQPITVQSHTTNFDLLTAAVNQLPVGMPDPLSTNLYGAVVSGLEASYRMGSIFEGECYSTLVVFADGYDTAARISERESIQKAQYFSRVNVTTLALGVSNRSDDTYLRQIATSGYSSTSSTESIVEAFEQMAQRIASLHRNVYYVLMCIPNRKGNVRVTVSLSPPEVYQNLRPLQYLVNTDEFGGGCSESVLNASITESQNNASGFANSSMPLPMGGSISARVGAYGALFFHTNCVKNSHSVDTAANDKEEEEEDVGCVVDARSDIAVSGDALTVLVSFEPSCTLSPFCFDDSFNKSYTLKANKPGNYQFMLLSGLGQEAVFTIVSHIPPQWIVPPPYLDRNQTGVRDTMGVMDQAAVIIFATSTVVICISICICIVFHCRQNTMSSYTLGTPYVRVPEKGSNYMSHSLYTSLDVPQHPHMDQQMDEVRPYRRAQL